MIARESSPSPPSGGMKRPRKILNRIGWLVAALLVLYIVLLIPSGERVSVPRGGGSSQKQPFAWNQDEYWNALEAT